MLVLKVLFVIYSGQAHVISREINFIAKLLLLFDEKASVLLACHHLRRHFILLNIHNLCIKVAIFFTQGGHVVRQIDVTIHVHTTHVQVDAKVSCLVLIIVEKLHAKHLVTLRLEINITLAVSYELPAQIDAIFLLKLLCVRHLVNLEMHFASVDSDSLSLIVTASNSIDASFYILAI